MRREFLGQLGHHGFFTRRRCLAPGGICQHALAVPFLDHLRRGRSVPGGGELGHLQQALGLAGGFGWHHQSADALASRPAGPARTVQQGFVAVGQLGVYHQIQVRQINTARRHIRRHADPGTAIAHRLQRMAPLGLGQLTGQGHHRKATVGQPAQQPVDHGAGVAEHNGIGRFKIAQHIDNSVFIIARSDRHRLIFDIAVLAFFRHGRDPLGIALIAFGQACNGRRHGGREQQCLTLIGAFAQNEFQIFAKAQIQHLIGFVQHHGAQIRQVNGAAHDMVAQTPGRRHHDMGTAVQRTTLIAHIHAAHTGGHHRAGLTIQPGQFPFDLHRQLAGWGNHQRQWRRGGSKFILCAQNRIGNGQAKPDGLTRPGLRRNQKVDPGKGRIRDRLLYRGQRGISTALKRQS